MRQRLWGEYSNRDDYYELREELPKQARSAEEAAALAATAEAIEAAAKSATLGTFII